MFFLSNFFDFFYSAFHFSKKQQPGVYIFTKRIVENKKIETITVDGLTNWKEDIKHQLPYCGKTKDINQRFYRHHKDKDLIGADFNCVCILCCDSENEAEQIEKDLLTKHNFKFNEILNNWELHFNEVVEEHNNLK